MRLLIFRTGGAMRLGARTAQGGVVDLAAAREALGAPDAPCDPGALFEGAGAGAGDTLPAIGDLVREASSAGPDAPWILPEGGLELGPPIPAPSKILCVGLNYRRHAAEAGMEPPGEPVLFSKFPNALAGPRDDVPLPPHARRYDYEAELAVVLGRRARYVREEEALAFVLGYACANDLSARDLQLRSSQWLLGKTLDRFLPLGPDLVTADEVGDPQRLPIRCWKNGDLRQDSNTSDMIFSVAEIVSYASRYMTLEPGDVIVTGTPEGVIFGRETKDWLEPGDVVEVEVGPLGRLRNRMVPERARDGGGDTTR